jgi:hypothetical protein
MPLMFQEMTRRLSGAGIGGGGDGGGNGSAGVSVGSESLMRLVGGGLMLRGIVAIRF